MPSSEYFPIEQISAKFPTPPGFSPEATRETGTVKTAAKGDLKDGKGLYGVSYLLFGPFFLTGADWVRSRGCSQLWTGSGFSSAAPVCDRAHGGEYGHRYIDETCDERTLAKLDADYP